MTLTFGKKQKQQTQPVSTSNKKEDVNVLIEQIHNEFDTATERLLENAKGILQKSASSKSERLANLGFHSHPEVIERQTLADRQRITKDEKDLAEKYSKSYPGYKFITRTDAKKIAEKYGLILGSINKFIGHVPEKNIQDMENISIAEQDVPYMKSYEYRNSNISFQNNLDEMMESWSKKEKVEYSYLKIHYKKVSNFHIVASLKDFDTTDMIVENNVLMKNIPDPVVLKPVLGGYIIVTKWGLETEIPEIN